MNFTNILESSVTYESHKIKQNITNIKTTYTSSIFKDNNI